jgi:hypothetical protein
MVTNSLLFRYRIVAYPAPTIALLPLALLSRIFGPSVAIRHCILGVFLYARVRIRNTCSLCNTISGLSFASAFSSSSPKEH